jgi:hypothetical protein
LGVFEFLDVFDSSEIGQVYSKVGIPHKHYPIAIFDAIFCWSLFVLVESFQVDVFDRSKSCIGLLLASWQMAVNKANQTVIEFHADNLRD